MRAAHVPARHILYQIEETSTLASKVSRPIPFRAGDVLYVVGLDSLKLKEEYVIEQRPRLLET